jgi:multicomponent Na+:H+ antiporter subunit C
METVYAFVIGVLYASGIYMMLRRSLGQVVIGLAILTNAANLLIFTSAGLTPERAPLVPRGEMAPVPPFADPVPQALILTAIVIGFGVLAFALVLAFRTYEVVESDDLDDMKTTEELD